MPYSSMGQVNPSIKGIKPPVSLAQANAIAEMADGVTGVDSPWAVAISQFKKSHTVEDGRWVRKEGSAFGKKKALHGAKAVTVNGQQYVVLWTSNTFKDRDGEFFSTPAWQEYVARVDALVVEHGDKARGRVRYWHLPGSEFASIVWQDLVGHILVEVARVDSTPYGQEMYKALDRPEDHEDVLPYGWGTSHGYIYLAGMKQGGVYSWVHKFESTVMPYHKASNLLAGVRRLLTMSKKEKIDSLAALLGGNEELAESLVEDAEKASDALGTTFDFKDFVAKMKAEVDAAGDEDDEDEEAKAAAAAAGEEGEEGEEEEEEEEGTKDTDDDGTQFFELELTDDLMAQIAAHVPVGEAVKEALNEMLPTLVTTTLQQALAAQKEHFTVALKEAVEQANLGSKEEIVQQALAGTLTLKPFTASQADGNVLPDTGDKGKGEKDSGASQGDKVTDLAVRMMQGKV